jgi:pimeloyl-ACP methyl ester carboxylesterase
MFFRPQGRLVRVLPWVKRIAIVLVAILLAGAGFEEWSRHAARRRFPPPGKMVEVAGAASHLYCTGQGAPTVLLEGGLDPEGTQGWSLVQPRVAEVTRVCSYDRGGIMWSAARDGARDAKTLASELHGLLAQAGESAPFVVVGHSLGGLIMRVFTATAPPGEVQGVVLVDSSHPEQFERNTRRPFDEPPATLIRAMARFGVLRLLANESEADPLPGEVQRRVLAFAPQSEWECLEEVAALRASLTQAREAGSLGERPLVVLQAADKTPDIAWIWPTLQQELAVLSSNSDLRIIPGSEHYIQQERPDAVVEAVRDVVVAVRGHAQVRRAAP